MSDCELTLQANHGLDEETEGLTHRELQERRRTIQEKFEGPDGPFGR